MIKPTLEREQRWARIKALRDELDELNRQEAAESCADMQAVEGECLRLFRTGDPVAAIKLYRNKTGLGLRESKDAIDRLRAKLA